MLAVAALLGAPQAHRDAPGEPERKTALVAPDVLFKPGEVCGDACRDPKAPGPVYHLAENRILPQLDSQAAAMGPGEVKDCPPLAELMPCLAGHKTMNDPYSSPCSACVPNELRTWPNGTRFEAQRTPARRTKPIYLIIAVPAFQGSSGLEGLFSSSPSVSTMCAKSVWQCEATATLMREGVFTRSSRYHPDATNWTHVYEVYNSLELGSIWNDPTRPILMDKSPPNLAKSKSMVEFFEKNQMDYRFVAMSRHPCMYGRMTDASFSLLMSYMRDVLANVPEEKIFKISYNDFVSRPDRVARNLLNWLPELVTLDINSSHLEWSGALGGGMGRVIPGTDFAYRSGVWKRTGVVSPPMDGVPAASDLEFRDGLWRLKANPPHRAHTHSATELFAEETAGNPVQRAHTQSATELFADGLGMLGAAQRFFTKSTALESGASTAASNASDASIEPPKHVVRATVIANESDVYIVPPKHVVRATVIANESVVALTFEEQEREGARLDAEEQARVKNASRGDRNTGDVSSLVGPSERMPSIEKDRTLSSEEESTFSGGEHGGRELPVMQYAARPECSLKVIKRRYNTNDALPFV